MNYYSRSPQLGQNQLNSVPPSPKGFGSRSGSAISLPGRGNIPPHIYNQQQTNSMRRRGGSREMPSSNSPTYSVEHLASFAVGRTFNLQNASDGIRKLKQMESNAAIWAQPMILRLTPNLVVIEDENGDLVEKFAMDLVCEPSAHQSNDPQDMYNNILLFIVKQDRSIRNGNPTEMHIFQCTKVSAEDVANDMIMYLQGHYDKVKSGRRDTNYAFTSNYAPLPNTTAAPPSHLGGANRDMSYHQNRGIQSNMGISSNIHQDDTMFADDNTDYYELDVTTLNHCFDDIERFVARLQSAALARQEIDNQNVRMKGARSSSKSRFGQNQAELQNGILRLRAQFPQLHEFHDVLQKFKLSFNLLAKLKNQIHSPNAPELLHFLFTPLTVILDASKWGLQRTIAEQVVSPLIVREARELLRNCLTSKEQDIWMSLGNAWRVSPEDWSLPLPPPYKPVFGDGFAPYGRPTTADQHASRLYSSGTAMSATSTPMPIHRGVSAPPLKSSGSHNSAYYGAQQRTVQQPMYGQNLMPSSRAASREHSMDNVIEIERMKLEQERLRFEQDKIRERERRLREEEERLRNKEERIRQEEREMKEMYEKGSVASDGQRRSFVSPIQATNGGMSKRSSSEYKMEPGQQGRTNQQPPTSNRNSNITQGQRNSGSYSTSGEISPRQLEFAEELLEKGAKIVQITHDRLTGHEKELTVSKGEYLEVMNDQKNWWQCRNANGKIGFVPKTILMPVKLTSPSAEHSPHINTKDVGQYKANKMAENRYGGVDGSKVYSKSLELEFLEQLKQTLNKSGGKKINLKRDNVQSVPYSLTNESNETELRSWLINKGFSQQIIRLFSKCDGKKVFALDKEVFQKYCGIEGDKLHSFLLVEKARSGYKPYTSRELEMLLQFRRLKTDQDDEAVGEEPRTLPPKPKINYQTFYDPRRAPALSESASEIYQENASVYSCRALSMESGIDNNSASSDEEPRLMTILRYLLIQLIFCAFVLTQETSTATACVDSDTKCTIWASQGECQANSIWMMSNCRKSCSNCGNRGWELRTYLAQTYTNETTNSTRNVHVESLRLNHVEMDEAKQVVKVFGRMVFSWNDSKVAWNKDQWGVSWLNFYWLQIFTPQLIQINGLSNSPGTITSKVLAANYTGQVYMWTDFNFAVPFNFVYEEYPNDYQRICYKFDDKRYFSVRFSVSPELASKQRAELGEVHVAGWTIEDLSVTDSKYVVSVLGDWKKDPFDIETNNCQLCIGMRRNAVYYTTEILIPALVTTVMTICAVLFQLSHTQVSLLAFSMVSQILSMMLINSRLPSYTSSVPEILKYAGFNLCATGFLFVLSLVLRKIAFSTSRVPPPHQLTLLCDTLDRFIPINQSNKENEGSNEGEYSKIAHTLNLFVFVIITLIYVFVIAVVFIF
uniref:SH3 domain-containing protein n=1 Tax=Rhabditophanes sp. KR3021 TaxID=114890 RepID=A0AC35U7H6_9BILA